MTHRGSVIPLTRRQQEQPDDSLKASVATLLEALEQARQARDKALAACPRLEAHIGLLAGRIARLERSNGHLRSLVGLKRRRRAVTGNRQLALALERDR